MNLNELNPYLSAYWNFDEDGSFFLDCINSIPLYKNGTIEQNIGIRKKSVSLDGQSHLNVYNGDYLGTSDGFLISAWVFFENTYVDQTNTYNADNNYVLEKGDYFSVSTQTLDYSKKWTATINGETLSGNAWNSATTDKWYHILIGASSGILFFSTRSSSGLSFKTSTYSGSLTPNTEDLLIGRTTKGRIDEMAIWSAPSITSVDKFLEIENEIYQSGKCLTYNCFKQLWEVAVTVNDVKTFDPLTVYPDSKRPSALSDIITYTYTKSATIEGNNASNNKATESTISSTSLSFDVLAPGETSKSVVIRLNVPNAKVVRNIKIGLIDDGGIPFSSTTFGITTRNYYDYNLAPETFFQGLSDGTPDSAYNISIENINSVLSHYIYLNVAIPYDFTFTGGTIRFAWFFDWA